MVEQDYGLEGDLVMKVTKGLLPHVARLGQMISSGLRGIDFLAQSKIDVPSGLRFHQGQTRRWLIFKY